MSTILSARELTKAFPAAILFEDVSLTIAEGDRIGLIGPNGAGKSTLLKILANLEPHDDGEITSKRNSSLIYIKQDDIFLNDATAMSAVLSAIANHELTVDDPDAEQIIDRETRAAIALSKIGFINIDQPINTLSGGWKKRLSLACALVHEPDIVLLDEPTNHLDLEGVLWLENFVKQATMAMVFVTHDRKFLENTATRIIEMSKAYPSGTFEVKGNYSEFIRRKEDFLNAQQQQQQSLANKVRRDTAWLRQGIQGRQTRNKTQVQQAADRRGELKATTNRNLAPEQTTTIDFQATERKTRKLLALHNIAKTLGNKQLFHNLDLTLTPGQRIGLLGVNGAGKTTLLKIMSGELQPDTGTVKPADNLRIVTFSQHRELDNAQTLQEALCPIGDTVNYRDKQVHITGWAKRFLFQPDQLAMLVSHLSGGERARVLIANLMLQPADILLLDEPTNDLDIPSLEVLEQALLEFPGAIVLITHDRFMLERIATEYIGLDNTGGIKHFQTYHQWNTYRLEKVKSHQAKENRQNNNKKVTVDDSASSSKPGKLSYREQREFDAMEETILAAEQTVADLEQQANDPALAADHIKATEIFQQLAEAQNNVQSLYQRWSELEERA